MLFRFWWWCGGLSQHERWKGDKQCSPAEKEGRGRRDFINLTCGVIDFPYTTSGVGPQNPPARWNSTNVAFRIKPRAAGEDTSEGDLISSKQTANWVVMSHKTSLSPHELKKKPGWAVMHTRGGGFWSMMAVPQEYKSLDTKLGCYHQMPVCGRIVCSKEGIRTFRTKCWSNHTHVSVTRWRLWCSPPSLTEKSDLEVEYEKAKVWNTWVRLESTCS